MITQVAKTKKLAVCLALLGFCALSDGDSYAVTQYEKAKVPFTTNVSSLKSSVKLKTKSRVVDLSIPYKKLSKRARKSTKDERVPPIQVYIPRKKSQFSNTIKAISKKGKEAELKQYFKKELNKNKKNKRRVLVDLSPETLKKVRLKEVGKIMSRSHHDVIIKHDTFLKNQEARKELLSQMKLFFDRNERIRISKKLKEKKDLIVHRDLLPKFARKMAKKFTIFRGPNCFHAALAFHGQNLTKSKKVNVKKEKGYHRAMINYDELWRAINRHFYEVDPNKSPLKYGDMLVFFNIPSKNEKSVNFRWIRHTATYLFDQYTFSKGSKSPNTPYSIKTLSEEWGTWDKYTKKLGVRIYRRLSRKSTTSTPEDLTDWIY